MYNLLTSSKCLNEDLINLDLGTYKSLNNNFLIEGKRIKLSGNLASVSAGPGIYYNGLFQSV